MGRFVDLTGQMIGEWSVLRREPGNYRGNVVWLCRCSCGIERSVVGTNLRNGISMSCGHPTRTAGGLSKRFTSEYDTWHQMHLRCEDPAHPRYKDWGAIGIHVCERWSDFSSFLSDMGPRPFPEAQLDRTDNGDGYYPENCEWVTPRENVQNSSAVRILEHDGLRLSVADWARRLGVKSCVLYSRLHYGWSVERTLTQPVRSATQPTENILRRSDRQYVSPRPRKRLPVIR